MRALVGICLLAAGALVPGAARKVDEILFQATFFLGAHAAHPF